MISFEIPNKKPLDELLIYLDFEGLSELIKQLNFLYNKKTDHLHLMSQEWGGVHLNNAIDKDNNQVNHVKILLINN